MKNIIILFILCTNYLFANTNLLKDEKNYINNNEFLCVSTNTWAPFNMDNEQEKLDGLALDYLNLIIKKSNLTVKCKAVSKWSDVVEAIKTKKADFTLATSISKSRKEFAYFSKPYLSYPIAIATTLDKVFISNEEYLSNKRIAVGEGYSAYHILKEKYKDIKFTIVKNTDEALKLLSLGKVDAVVDILPVLSYNITKLGLANLKITGITKSTFDVRFMFNKDPKLLPLIDIINKNIDSLTTDEKRIISDKWTSVKFEKEFDYVLFYQIIIPIILFFIYLFYTNKKLLKEIKLRKNIQRKLEEKVNIDNLTGVFNRHYLKNITEELITNTNRHKEELSLLMIDIDNFKIINDSFGHIAGDDVLREVTYKLKDLTRPSDIIIRYGGEEFLILLKKTSKDEAIIVCEKLRRGIEELQISSSGLSNIFNVTISLGLVSYNYKKYSQIKDAIYDADIALYKAKHDGKNKTVVFGE